MKISLKRNKLFLIIGSSILLLIIVLFFSVYIYKSRRGTINIGRFQETLEACEVSRGKDLEITCSSFLNYYEDNGDGTSDFYLTIVTPEYDYRNLEYTLDNELYSTEGVNLSTHDFESSVPLYVNLNFEYGLFEGYSLQSVTNTRISDAELNVLTEGLFDKRKKIPSIESTEEMSIDEKGYYLSNPLEIGNKEVFGRAYLFNVEISQPRIEDTQIILDTTFEIEGGIYNATLSTKSFLINNKLYTPQNVNEYEFDGEYQMGIFYLLNDNQFEREELNQFCNQSDLAKELIALCTNLESMNLEGFEIIDFDEYLSGRLDKENDKSIDLGELILTEFIEK